MRTPDPTRPDAAPAPAADGFNPFRLLDVETLEGATLDRYAVFLVGLRRTLRDALAAGGQQDSMLREFLDEVEEALADALAARRRRRP